MSAIEAINRKAFQRLTFATLSIIIVFPCSSVAAADPIRVVGIGLGRSDDFAVIDGLDLETLVDEAVINIGVSGGRARDTIINGRITVISSTTGEAAQLYNAESTRPTYSSRRSKRHEKYRRNCRHNLNRPVETNGTGVIGIVGGDGNDMIINSGDLLVDSDFTVDINDITFELIDSGDVSHQAIASAKGISSGRGHDRITNDGQVTVIANATVDRFMVNVDLIGGATDIDASSLASAAATGIDGGSGSDYIANSGTTTVTANAKANSDQINISLLNALQGESARAPLHTDATGMGIVGGNGHDIIVNSGTLEVTADAKADALDLEFGAVDLSSGETSTSSKANAVGIDGGLGYDRISNTGKLNVGANATTSTKGVSISLLDLSLIPDLFDTAGDASTSSIADVTGIRGDSDRDIITNDGDITTTADAKTTTFDLSWSADGISNPADIGDFINFFRQESVIDASTTAEAIAVGINSGDGHDVVYNNGKIDAKANSEVSAATLSVGFPFPDIIPITLPGIDTTEVATAATSNATGIFGGDGDNAIHNEGSVLAKADAKATSLAVGVTIEPSIPGGDNDQDGGFSYSLEGNLVDVGAQTEVDALGIETGKGHDTLINKDSVTAKATAKSIATDVEVKLAQADDTISANLSLGNASTEGSATAVGITTGSGHDVIANEGDILAETLADTDSTTVSVDLELLEDTRASAGAIITKANTEADARSIGVTTGGGEDKIHNSGSVTARANANADAVGVIANVSAQLSEDFGIIGEGAWASTDTNASVDAEGINGGEGADQIWNEGSVAADAKADAHSVSVSAVAAGTKKGASIGVALTQANSEAEANSTGISGGAHNDKITNSGMVNSKAVSDVEAESVSVALTLTDKGVALTGTAADGSTKSKSTSQGITGDDGMDSIQNEDTVDVYSEANATSVSVSVAAEGASKGVALGLALSKATSEAEADSTGISGGTNRDMISSSGLVKSWAKSKVIAGSGALAAGGSGKGLTVEGAGADAATIGLSTAEGISGDQGHDFIRNQETVDVFADADATSVAVAVSASGTGTGVNFGVGLARATSEAEANSSGISGGEDSDKILSTGMVKSHAKSKVIAGSGALAAGGTGKGLTVEGAASDASTKGSAIAKGISGDQGRDYIVSDETVDVLTDADTTSVSVAVSGNFTGTGVTLGVGLARSASEAETNSNGISGGADSDKIFSSGLVKSHAKSKVVAGSGALAGGGTGKGVVLEGAAADGLSKGLATATGITGGTGYDVIHSDGEIDVYSEANTTGVSVAASANGTGAGVALGVALSRASSEAEANSTGISGGEDNDVITSANSITAHAKSDVDAVTVSASLGGLGAGVTFQGTGADSATIGSATALGITGGDGIDSIRNENLIDTLADTKANSTSVSVSVSGAGKGVALGASLARANTQASANSTGISIGDNTESGKKHHGYSSSHRKKHYDDDHHDYPYYDYYSVQQVDNFGAINSTALADADSVTVAVELGVTGVGVAAGASLTDASTDASVNAYGIEGSSSKDIINNVGTIDAYSNADADSVAVSASLNISVKGAAIGATFTDASTKSLANSFAITGNAGNDDIYNQGAVSSKAKADSTGTNVSVNVGIAFVPLGVAVADMETLADANAQGINGGEGHDMIMGSGSVLADADAKATGTTVSFSPIGASFGAADTNSIASAIGVNGGDGNEDVYQNEMITSNAKSSSTGTTISVALIGAAGSILDSADTNADASAIAIAGGDGYDHIANIGILNSTANADTKDVSVSVAPVGAAIGNVNSTAKANATGIDAGQHSDKIKNHGVITATAKAETKPTNVSVSLVGAALNSNTTTTDATAQGINGGEGHDWIHNGAEITATSTATTNATGISVALVGAALGNANVNAFAHSSGINGGDGRDHIWNHAKITSNSTANTSVANDNWSVAGFSSDDSTLTPKATALGIDAGDNDDWITNKANVELMANATASAKTRSVTILAGAAGANAGTNSTSEAIGLYGNAGHDHIYNKGDITGKSTVTTTASSFKYTTIGVGLNSDAQTSGEAFITGIDGGSDHDGIYNTALIDIDSKATTKSSGKSLSIIGLSSSSDALAAKAGATGITGGTGTDWIHNDALIKVLAEADVDVKSSSLSIIGAANSGGSGNAEATAFGLDGGDDSDYILNMANIEVDSSVKMTLDSGTFDFFGASESSGSLLAQTLSTGINGGTGHDWIDNQSLLTVKTTSTLMVKGNSKVIFGNTIADATTSANPLAIGIDTGTGNDMINNDAVMNVMSTATTTSNRTAYAFGGQAQVNSTLAANAKAKGINSGLGDDKVYNKGNITVNSTSSLSATGGATVTFGRAISAATVSAGSQTSGIETDEGNDKIINLANITATAKANSSSLTDANAGVFFSDGKTRSTSTTTSIVHGMDVGSGDNFILNKGNIAINTMGRAFADADSDGDIIDNILGIDQDAFATATSTVSKSEAIGIIGGYGRNVIKNLGNISVNVAPEGFSDSFADGDAIISGDGTANATSRADNTKAYAIKLGHGNNWIMNRGTVTVKTKPRVNAKTKSDADGVGIAREPDSRANSFAYANNALAVGIWAGDGNNQIINKGILNIESAPNADKADAFGDFGGDVLGIDSFARATATANDAKAYGIQVGHGDNAIWNWGTISVATRPRAVTMALARGVGLDGDAHVWANSNANNALAVGIRTGNGDNMVINRGNINVTAAPFAFADATASPSSTGEVEAFEENATVVNAQAIGIWTGDGDDYISNEGIITVDATGSSPVEVAVRSGAGDDRVLLGDLSSITGDIELGEDDDTLHLFGTPVVNGSTLGGAGTDALVFDGEGSFDSDLTGFENALKQGSGTYSLLELPTMQRLEVNLGTLQIESDYQMSADSTYQTFVDGNGDFGQLSVGGTVDLDGALAVSKGRHAFMDETTFDVVSAIKVDGEFASEELPAPTPLLSFDVEQTDTSVLVETSVNSFVSVADSGNNVGRSVAGYLDRILPTASDDISLMLGGIQGLSSKSQINHAYGSLCPDAYDNFTTSMLSTVETHIGAAHDRMAAMRAKIGPRKRGGGAAFLPGGEPSFFNTVESGLTPTNTTSGVWSLNFNENSAWQGLRNGYQGFSYDTSGTTMGFDYRMGERSIMGASFASTYTDLEFDSGLADGNIDSFLTSTYGTHFFGSNTYVETVLSYGRSESESLRSIQVGSDQHAAFSTHDGDMFSAFVEVGQAFGPGEWGSEVFGSMRYASLFEEGFRETGADELDLIIDDRRSDSLVSVLGLRVGRSFQSKAGVISSQVSAGWVHDFNIDDREITARFAGSPNETFTIEGRDIDSNGARLGGVLTFRSSDEFDVSAKLNAELYENSSNVSGLIQFNIRF